MFITLTRENALKLIISPSSWGIHLRVISGELHCTFVETKNY